MLSRLSGHIKGLLACGIARHAGNDIIELFLNADEAATGGMVTIPMRVPVRCPACAANPTAACEGAAANASSMICSAPGSRFRRRHDGEILPPSALLPGMINRVLFRARCEA